MYKQLSYCYFLVNKRLDEWVEEERLDLSKLQLPKKEDAKKTSKGKGAGSRPCSPDRELVNGVGSGRPKAIVGRKRKANAMDKSGDEVLKKLDRKSYLSTNLISAI